MLLKKTKILGNQTIEISGSKSISNRLLILQQLLPQILLENLSDSEDTFLLKAALESNSSEINIHHTGTAMRFLTAFFAAQVGRTVTLTGSERMKKRPIKSLVNALRNLGANIEYVGEEGFPPLKISGCQLTKNSVEIPASVSSQFITALMLIGTTFSEGFSLKLIGKITSRPYLDMTLKILRTLDIPNSWEDNIITISPPLPQAKNYATTFTIESDWSSASYFYSIAAISRATINLRCFKPYSLQGDSVLRELFWNFFGVNTISEGAESKISLLPEPFFTYPESIELNMNDCPDIVQTICVTATALKIPFAFTGLETLRIKETDRLAALKNELLKIGCICDISEDSIVSRKFFEPSEVIRIETYEDHRMAMSFAPFSILHDISIENPEVVAKSYPQFWNDFNLLKEQQDLLK